MNNNLRTKPWMVLGDGSNTLFTRDFKGVVLHMQTKGKSVVAEDVETITFSIAAGESWIGLVEEMVNQGYGGIENLALIPGTVGAAPVQNIAAYGQNVSDVIEAVEAYDVDTDTIRVFTPAECEFEYRSSYFKKHPGKYIILSVTMRLSKNPRLETSYYSIGGRYDSLEQELNTLATPPFTIKNVYDAVVSIRTRKLLDPKEAPTVGSFFINPLITKAHYDQLAQQIEGLQMYPVSHLRYVAEDELPPEATVKIPAGRLIDALGWRGRQIGNCKVSEKLASIITHNGKASGEEVLAFANTIKADIKSRYNVELTTEVNII